MTDVNVSVAAGAAGYRRGVILVIMAGVLWSTIGLGVRLMEVANVWQILFYRSMALAVFLFIIISIRSGGKPFPVIRKVGIAGAVGGVGLVFAFAGGIYAIQTTTVANAMFLFASAPFITALLGRLILGEFVRTATWVSMAVAMSGIVIMVYQGFSAGHMAGNIAALLSAVGFATFTIAIRWQKLEDMLPAVFLAGIFATITAGVICLIYGYTFAIPNHDILIAIAMGIFQVGAGLTVYTIGSKHVPAAELALLALLEVVLGPIWVWALLGETVGVYTLLGGGILLLALVGNALSGVRRKPVPVM
ncbi:MAG: DMT family transporter [Rhodospirillales bacterium]|jgi:drug/metabolite transporter, DME family|nr:DMT family transporter [Rhodospirillales bacterium]MBT4038976.1 DMT family transporter [Rhodospirillales bacterium]MBT4626648.1 DMT family transporter [Rhodospirillales bacterium]MBT5351880.1 DMT family transporter [Rhodospirillales bacterium]MBT5520632.1 DMT family transporter [Rhodospirillales bacterium]